MIRGREPLPNYDQIRSWILGHVPRAIKRHDLAALMENRPPGLDIVILDKDDVVTIVHDRRAARGNRRGGRRAVDVHRRQRRALPLPGGQRRASTARDDSLVILKLPRMRPEVARFRNLTIQVVIYTSIALLVFSSLMSFLILRSLNGSIQSLEGATRRIADGDLDFELPARGNDQISSLTRSFDSMRRRPEGGVRAARALHHGRLPRPAHPAHPHPGLRGGHRGRVRVGAGGAEEVPLHHPGQDPDPGGHGRGADRVRAHGNGPVADDPPRGAARGHFLTDLARRFAEDALILKRDFAWSIDIPEEATVRMDAGLFTRALENLVGNAIRYTDRDGEDHDGGAARRDGSMLLSITDTGIGIPPEDLSRIYDPFYRGTNSRREQGFGLGLTTVKSIIESHGWSITVASQCRCRDDLHHPHAARPREPPHDRRGQMALVRVRGIVQLRPLRRARAGRT